MHGIAILSCINSIDLVFPSRPWLSHPIMAPSYLRRYSYPLTGLTRGGVSQVVDQGPKGKEDPFLMQQKRILRAESYLSNDNNKQLDF